jgi:hypothetical protein
VESIKFYSGDSGGGFRCPSTEVSLLGVG